jgi:toxin-antitoxin system PIN domain toxin
MFVVRLLDINVLIALVDPWHVFHALATNWMVSNSVKKWATCPVTENGFLRVFGHPEYKNGPGSPAGALPFLRQMYAFPGHEFWPLDLSFATGKAFRTLDRIGPSQLTDLLLLGQAAKRRGRFTTFDTRVRADAVQNGEKYLEVIPTGS